MVHRRFGEEENNATDDAMMNGHDEVLARGEVAGDVRMPDEETMQRHRERRDQIAKIMGEYLLRGYRMLNEYCDVCTNILLQSRQGEKYCVACREVDNAPVEQALPVRQSSTIVQSLMLEESAGNFAPTLTAMHPPQTEIVEFQQSETKALVPESTASPTRVEGNEKATMRTSQQMMKVLENKMQWACGRLEKEENACRARDLVELIRACKLALDEFE